jgi:hypothetical protein
VLHREEVSSPEKTINIKQYLSTSYFLVDNRYFVIISSRKHNFILQKYLIHKSVVMITMHVILNRENKQSDVSCGVWFYSLIKFNQKILILSRFVAKNDFSYVIMKLKQDAKRLNVYFLC